MPGSVAKGTLSNLYPCHLQALDRWYTSSEQAYQHRKAYYHNDKEAIRDILQARDSREALLRRNRINTSPDWEKNRENYMTEILWAKFEHCTEYRDRLMKTTSSQLHEGTSHPHWGGNRGKDRLGQLHMLVHSENQSKYQQEAHGPWGFADMMAGH